MINGKVFGIQPSLRLGSEHTAFLILLFLFLYKVSPFKSTLMFSHPTLIFEVQMGYNFLYMLICHKFAFLSQCDLRSTKTSKSINQHGPKVFVRYGEIIRSVE